MKKILQHLQEEWYKYLLEILVITIGILGAFLLNNWNESRKEQNSTKVLAASLVADMQKDVDFLLEAKQWSKRKLESCDSILKLCSEPREKWDSIAIYNHMNWVSQSNPFFPTNGTYEQMVTSGTLKSFDQSIANDLNAYNMQLKKIVYWANAEDQTLWLMGEIMWRGMNVRAMGDIRFNEELQNLRYIRIPADRIEEFLNLVAAVKMYRKKTMIEYDEHLRLGSDLIQTLKSEYQL